MRDIQPCLCGDPECPLCFGFHREPADDTEDDTDKRYDEWRDDELQNS